MRMTTSCRNVLNRLSVALQLRLIWLPVLCLVTLVLIPVTISTRLNLLAYDLLSQALTKTERPVDSVVIAIDEASLKQFGAWPWSRQRQADLLALLLKAESGPVAFAILFLPKVLKVLGTTLSHNKLPVAQPSCYRLPRHNHPTGLAFLHCAHLRNCSAMLARGTLMSRWMPTG